MDIDDLAEKPPAFDPNWDYEDMLDMFADAAGQVVVLEDDDPYSTEWALFYQDMRRRILDIMLG